jgi:hypothetical protein
VILGKFRVLASFFCGDLWTSRPTQGICLVELFYWGFGSGTGSSYIRKLLENPEVKQFLNAQYADVLNEFAALVELESL